MTKLRLSSVYHCLAASCLLGIQAHALAVGATASSLSVSICDDENEWPPYSYFERVNGNKTATITGYAVAVVEDIFKRRGVRYSINLIPWPRCLAVVVIGQEYGMVLNLSHSPARARDFLFTRPYYATTAYYYYSRRSHPDGLQIATAADVRKYRVCGLQGYNYDGYGLGNGEVDQGAKSFEALVRKLQLGRCSLFLEKDEVMNGYAAIGKDYLADPDIARAPIPGMKPNNFYFGISKRYAQARQLHSLMDEELRTMEANGKLGELWKKTIGAARTCQGTGCKSAARP